MRQTFWTGQTGRALRGKPEAQILAAYLITAPGHHPSGLFFLPIVTAAHHTGIGVAQLCAAMSVLEELGFIEVDDQSEAVWVVNMADEQMPAGPATETEARDLLRHLRDFAGGPLYRRWMDRYGERFRNPCSTLGKTTGKPLETTETGHVVVSPVHGLNQEEKMPRGTGRVEDPSPKKPARIQPDGSVNWLEMVPESLSASPEFIDAYDEWLKSRRERKLKPLGKIGLRKQLEFLGRLGVVGALASIDASVRNGWQGLFEPRPGLQRAPGGRSPAGAARGTDFGPSDATAEALAAAASSWSGEVVEPS